MAFVLTHVRPGSGYCSPYVFASSLSQIYFRFHLIPIRAERTDFRPLPHHAVPPPHHDVPRLPPPRPPPRAGPAPRRPLPVGGRRRRRQPELRNGRRLVRPRVARRVGAVRGGRRHRVRAGRRGSGPHPDPGTDGGRPAVHRGGVDAVAERAHSGGDGGEEGGAADPPESPCDGDRRAARGGRGGGVGVDGRERQRDRRGGRGGERARRRRQRVFSGPVPDARRQLAALPAAPLRRSDRGPVVPGERERVLGHGGGARERPGRAADRAGHRGRAHADGSERGAARRGYADLLPDRAQSDQGESARSVRSGAHRVGHERPAHLRYGAEPPGRRGPLGLRSALLLRFRTGPTLDDLGRPLHLSHGGQHSDGKSHRPQHRHGAVHRHGIQHPRGRRPHQDPHQPALARTPRLRLRPRSPRGLGGRRLLHPGLHGGRGPLPTPRPFLRVRHLRLHGRLLHDPLLPPGRRPPRRAAGALHRQARGAVRPVRRRHRPVPGEHAARARRGPPRARTSARLARVRRGRGRAAVPGVRLSRSDSQRAGGRDGRAPAVFRRHGVADDLDAAGGDRGHGAGSDAGRQTAGAGAVRRRRQEIHRGVRSRVGVDHRVVETERVCRQGPQQEHHTEGESQEEPQQKNESL
mmetsp:Transcript_25356/g.50512  ORF Transcript_25356/g.50512 Transcript_25356/m.50512 type:complete len:636 (-) Transcript_25356:581-2488(-)